MRECEDIASSCANLSSRLVDGIRNAPDPSNNAILSKIWDRPTNYDVDEQFKSDLRAASGIGKSGKGKGKVRSLYSYYRTVSESK